MNIAMARILTSRWLAAIMLALAAVMLAPKPAGAQTDRRFFGTWKPASTSAGGLPLTVAPGRITIWNKDKLIWDQRYEVIRDFGDHIVIRKWTVESSFDHPLNKSSLAILSVERHVYEDYRSYILGYDFCASDHAHDYFFQTSDKDEIWRRILSWSARRRDRGFPFDECILNEDGGEVGGWNGMGFSRAARPGE